MCFVNTGTPDPNLVEGVEDPGVPTPCLVVNVTLRGKAGGDLQFEGDVKRAGAPEPMETPPVIAYGPLYQDKASYESWAQDGSSIVFGDIYHEDTFPPPYGSLDENSRVHHRILRTLLDPDAAEPLYEGVGCTAFACPQSLTPDSYNKTREMLEDWLTNVKKLEIGSKFPCFYNEDPTARGWTGLMVSELWTQYVPPIISRKYFDPQIVWLSFFWPMMATLVCCFLYLFAGCREWCCSFKECGRPFRSCQYY